MPGETSMHKLLSGMSPQLNEGRYVFCTVENGKPPGGVEIIGSFREAEGLTLIVALEEAQQAGLAYEYIAAWITLNVHSSLQAVGLTAAVAQALAEAGISCNVIAAYYHDHIFVGEADGHRALGVLRTLAGTQQ